MSAPRRGPVVSLVLLVGLALLLTPRSTSAAFSDPQNGAPLSPRDQALLKTFSPEEIQAVRDQLSSITSDLLQIQTMIGLPANQPRASVISAQEANLRDVDIARWLAAGVDLGPLQRDVAAAKAKTSMAVLRNQKGAVSPATTAGFPVAQYGSACAGYTSNSDVVFGYETALNTAKLVWIPLKDACDEVLVALGEGGNTSLACIIPDEILQAAELILAQYTICDGDTQSAQVAANYDRLAYINEQIDGDYNATISNDNANKNAIVANDNSNAAATQANDNNNKNTIVANDNANAAAIQTNDDNNKNAIIANDNSNTAAIIALIQQNQGQIMKSFIETNLASSETPLGTFELPLSQGGQLETARDIAANLIASLHSAGLGVGNAVTYLSQGNNYLASGQYKLAYARFRAAYQAATNPGY